MTPTAALDPTLPNIAASKAVLRKKHNPDDELLTNPAGDETPPQWASNETLNEPNAIASPIGGDSYQLAQASPSASPGAAAPAVTPVVESTSLTHLILGGALVGVAAGAAGKSGSGTSVAQTDTTAHNFVDGVVTAGPVIIGNGLTVNLYKADGTTLLKSGTLNGSGQFHIDIGSYTGVVIAKVIDANAGADYMDEATGLAKNLNANLMAVAVVTGGVVTLNINPVTTIAAIKAGLASDGSGHVDATSVGNANAAVAAAFGLGDITTTTPSPPSA